MAKDCRNPKSERPILFCDHCKRNGHDRDHCFLLKGKQKSKPAANFTSKAETEDEKEFSFFSDTDDSPVTDLSLVIDKLHAERQIFIQDPGRGL